jgi:hypothetical protein
MRLIILITLMLCSIVANAATTIINFEEFDFPTGTLDFYESIESKGYTFSAPLEGSVFAAGTVPFGNSNTIATCADFGSPQCGIALTNNTSAAFAVKSFDYYVNAYPIYEGETFTLEVTGYQADGGELFLTIPGVGTDPMATHIFSEEWDNIVKFEVLGSGAFDNFVVSAAVPVPAAVWLFVSALTGLGWLRRN